MAHDAHVRLHLDALVPVPDHVVVEHADELVHRVLGRPLRLHRGYRVRLRRIRGTRFHQPSDGLCLELARVSRALAMVPSSPIASGEIRNKKSVHINGNRGLIAIRPRIKKAATVPPRMLQRALSKEDPPQHWLLNKLYLLDRDGI